MTTPNPNAFEEARTDIASRRPWTSYFFPVAAADDMVDAMCVAGGEGECLFQDKEGSSSFDVFNNISLTGTTNLLGSSTLHKQQRLPELSAILIGVALVGMFFRRGSKTVAAKDGPQLKTTLKAENGVQESQLQQQKRPYKHEDYMTEPRVTVFWMFFLWIYLTFQSFSCGRGDRLWRLSDVFNAAPPVLMKPMGISFLWYEMAGHYMASVENVILFCMVVLAIPPEILPQKLVPRRFMAVVCGLGWLYMHAYEHSMMGGSHTHLMPAICMMCLALPQEASVNMIRQWNTYLLFSAGLCKLFNGDHHPWWAWMDGQSMQFYFANNRTPVPEPYNTWTMEHDWFAAAQCIGSVIFECTTFFLLFSKSYRLVFPLLAAKFHFMIWYTIGINYLTSVVIQFTLVLDGDDWKSIREMFTRKIGFPQPSKKVQPGPPPRCPVWAKAICVLNAAALIFTILKQIEYWPLSNIPMYSGYRPHAGYNTTHITNRTYLDHLVNECAPHVWSRHWTDVMVTNTSSGDRYKMTFCAKSRVVQKRGVKDICMIPDGNKFDTERHDLSKSESLRLEPKNPVDENGKAIRYSMRPGGWNRQKPSVVIAELPGRYHVYCQSESLTPSQDWLHRNCAFLRSMGFYEDIEAELVVNLGTGQLVVGEPKKCDDDDILYPADRVPRCYQTPFH